MIFISVKVYLCDFQDVCPLRSFCSCISQKPSKKPVQKTHKNLWQKSLTKTLQKPHKNLVGQKLLYIFKHSN